MSLYNAIVAIAYGSRLSVNLGSCPAIWTSKFFGLALRLPCAMGGFDSVICLQYSDFLVSKKWILIVSSSMTFKYLLMLKVLVANKLSPYI